MDGFPDQNKTEGGPGRITRTVDEYLMVLDALHGS